MAMGMSTCAWERRVASSFLFTWRSNSARSRDFQNAVVEEASSSVRSCGPIAGSFRASASSSSPSSPSSSSSSSSSSSAAAAVSKVVLLPVDRPCLSILKEEQKKQGKFQKSNLSDLVEHVFSGARTRVEILGGRRWRLRAAMSYDQPSASDSDMSFASTPASTSDSDGGRSISTIATQTSDGDENDNDDAAKHRQLQIRDAIAESLSSCLTSTSLDVTIPAILSKREGKVRDMYDAGELLVVVTTDRQSAFDRILASVPFKGQVLNETSGWWFEKTSHIVPNAALCKPDPNVTIFRKCSVFPIEFVVRGYITGTTSTSLWTVYNSGKREYCGNFLAEGLVKNDKLEKNILTPTTKAEDHDVPISPEEIIRMGLMTREDVEYLATKALALFAYGQEVAAANGLLLVDTKYEFGRAPDGTIMLLDEIHTPDSSRYWIASSYAERHAAGLEPESIDKEFLRLWFKDNCDPYNDVVLPDAPKELVTQLSSRYIRLYEMVTGNPFRIPNLNESMHDRISQNVDAALSSFRVGGRQ